MKYNKLIRDKIPEIIKKSGLKSVTHIADDKEYKQKLRAKLQEEVDEFLEESNEEELAEIFKGFSTVETGKVYFDLFNHHDRHAASLIHARK